MGASPSDIIQSNNYALAKKDHLAKTVETFQEKSVIWPLVAKQVMTGKKTDSDLVLGTSGDAAVYEDDTDLPGDSLDSAERLISLEDQQTLKNYKRTYVEDIVDHTDTRQQLSMNTGKAVLRTTEKHCFQVLALGARTAASTPVPAGITHTVGGASVEAAFPKTEAGSKAIQDVLSVWTQKAMETDVDVEEDDLFSFVNPYLLEVLNMDDSLKSRDYDGPDVGNSKIRGKIIKVKNFWVLPSNLLPSADLSAVTTGPKVKGSHVYRGDFTNLAFLGMKAGAVRARHTPIRNWMEWVNHRQRWDIGAGFIKGLAVGRPEYCMECVISGS